MTHKIILATLLLSTTAFCTKNYEDTFYINGQKRGAIIKSLIEGTTPFSLQDFTSLLTIKKDLAIFNLLAESPTLDKKYLRLIHSYLRGLNATVSLARTKKAAKARALIKELIQEFVPYALRATSTKTFFMKSLPFIGHALYRLDELIANIDWYKYVSNQAQQQASLDLSTLKDTPAFTEGLSVGLKLAEATDHEALETLLQEIFSYALKHNVNASNDSDALDTLPLVQYCAGILLSQEQISGDGFSEVEHESYDTILDTIGETLASLVGSYHYEGETFSTSHQSF